MQLVKNHNVTITYLSRDFARHFSNEFELLYEGRVAATMPYIKNRSGPNTPDRQWASGELVFILKTGLYHL